MDGLKRVGILIAALMVVACASTTAEPVVETPQQFVERVNKELVELNERYAKTAWIAATYITDDTQALEAAISEEALAFTSRVIEEAKRYNNVPMDDTTARAIKLLKLGATMPAPDDADKRAELAKIASGMGATYGKGKYCPDGEESCKDLGELSKIMAESRDPEELLEAWTGWRTISPVMRKDYERFAELTNEGARELGFDDVGVLWRAGYDMPAEDFNDEVERLWSQVTPLYDELHCHVRANLAEVYGEELVKPGEPIPAHLLGNMWSQSWGNVYDLMEPYPGVSNLNVTQSLVDQDYDAEKMTRQAESFFTSIGWPDLPDSFYEKSMLTKPRDRDVVCHASAWPMDNQDDVRIKMCTKIDEEDLETIYHELGHIYYFLLYKDLPPIFKGGAHDGFHEAIGDTIVLSMTPGYLKSVGLIDTVDTDEKAVINQQMKIALDRIAFLPFGKLMDQWRWGVFSGDIAPEDYNKAWWELRTKYQGIKPPVARSEADFDPGAKYHIPGNTPYTRYFLSFILQFQFHQALCEAAGETGPLHECSIVGNEVAGKKFGDMLAMGASQPWQEALEKVTGGRQMEASAIVEYFSPLMGYLKEQNASRECGWSN